MFSKTRSLVLATILTPAMFSFAGDSCGDPAAGACDQPNGTPGCDDLDCCQTVCQIDAFCCEGAWDDACVAFAADSCDGSGGGGGDQPNDNCADATEVEEGTFIFSTVGATPDGPELPSECDEGFGTAFAPDVWFLLTPDVDTGVTVSTCGTIDYDSRLAVYLDCGGALIACNDDGPDCPNYSSLMTFQALAGESYAIRVGGYGEAVGSGTISITYGELPPPYPTRILPVWTAADGGNGHAYGVISIAKDSTFDQVEFAAAGFGADLATTASPAESDFVRDFARVSDPNVYDRAAFGLVQDSGAAEPSGGWGWINSEPLKWTNWRAGEPNDNPAPENFGELYADGQWNDCFDADFGQVVLEFDVDPGFDDGVAWTVSSGGNGHVYQPMIVYPEIDWDTARQMAEEAGGHLVTFETDEERLWVQENLMVFTALWSQPTVGAINVGPMIGLEKINGVWTWLGDEPLDYDGWLLGEPSGDGLVASMGAGFGSGPAPTFNDQSNDVLGRSFIIEFDDVDPGDCPTDLNGDGQTDGNDFGLMLTQWGPCAGCSADLDGNGIVAGPDVGLLLVGWGFCP